MRFMGPGPGAKGQGAQGTPGVGASEGLARESRKPQWAGHQRGADGSPHGPAGPQPGKVCGQRPQAGAQYPGPLAVTAQSDRKATVSETEAGMAALGLKAVLGTVFARSPKMGKLQDCPSPPRVEAGTGPDLALHTTVPPCPPQDGLHRAGDWVQPVPVLSATRGQGLPSGPRPPTHVTTGNNEAWGG